MNGCEACGRRPLSARRVLGSLTRVRLFWSIVIPLIVAALAPTSVGAWAIIAGVILVALRIGRLVPWRHWRRALRFLSPLSEPS